MRPSAKMWPPGQNLVFRVFVLLTCFANSVLCDKAESSDQKEIDLFKQILLTPNTSSVQRTPVVVNNTRKSLSKKHSETVQDILVAGSQAVPKSAKYQRWRPPFSRLGDPPGVSDPLISDKRYEYVGCFVDQEAPRSLSGYYDYFHHSNSPETCIGLCIEVGYMYAGLQDSFQCFCGDEHPVQDKRVDQRECKYRCTGDTRFICGGDYRNSIYKTGNADPLISDKRYEYVGCFVDQEAPRSLSGYYDYFHHSNSPETCIGLCIEVGYMYAGLQDSFQCFCGDEHPVQDKRVDQRECKYRCTGDTRFICGGDYRNSIYKTGNADPLISDKRYEYVGCFVDQEAPRSLSGYYDYFHHSNSPATCIGLCIEVGYMYAGLQDSFQCFCGDEHPVQDKRVDQTECKYRCTGDTRFICGGDYRNSIYKTGNADPLISDKTYKYVGCFVDQEEPRSLSGSYDRLHNSNSPSTCIALCKEEGYMYAGLQFSFQCFCGDEHPVQDKRVDQTECKYRCTGDTRFICGGDYRNSIYKTGNADPLISDKRYEYVGCFVDQEEPRSLSGSYDRLHNSNSPSTCIALCKEEGYMYAGLQFSFQCFCGDEHPVQDKRVDQRECKYRCTGDTRFICGGDYRNSIYKTGNADPLISDKTYEYVGCFVDQEEPRSLSGSYDRLHNNNSPSTCIALCKEEGYMYAGLQFSFQCFCGDEHPVQDKRVDQTECKYRCTGDTRFICGGDYRNSIYKTGNADPLISDKRYEYVGCFVDQEAPRSLSGSYDRLHNSNSPSTCIALCKEEGYMYAGLQFRYQCFCGDEDPVQDKRVDQRECKYRCTGDTRFICGGDYRNSIYKLEMQVFKCK